MKHIVIIGSTNTDMVVKATRIPAPGETILGGQFMMNPGGKGAYAFDGTQGVMVEAVKVQTVDTTAAGDVFNGALAVALTENRELPDSVAFAARAAAVSVTRMGAQASAPYRHEVTNQRLQRLN